MVGAGEDFRNYPIVHNPNPVDPASSTENVPQDIVFICHRRHPPIASVRAWRALTNVCDRALTGTLGQVVGEPS
jgi:hypothetical protein